MVVVVVVGGGGGESDMAVGGLCFFLPPSPAPHC